MVFYQHDMLIKRQGGGSEIQIERKVILRFFVDVSVFNSPCDVASDEIAEDGGSQSQPDAAHDGFLQPGDADVQVAVGVV